MMLCEMHWTSESGPFASSCLGRGPEPLLFVREVLTHPAPSLKEHLQAVLHSRHGLLHLPDSPVLRATNIRARMPIKAPSRPRRVELVGGMGIGALLNVLEPPRP